MQQCRALEQYNYTTTNTRDLWNHAALAAYGQGELAPQDYVISPRAQGLWRSNDLKHQEGEESINQYIN